MNSRESETGEQPPVPPPKKQYPYGKKLYYMKEISEIINHSTDGKCGVRFEIQWKGFMITDRERSPFIVNEFPEGRRMLMRYIRTLMRLSTKRFKHMIERQPDLAELFDVGPALENARAMLEG